MSLIRYQPLIEFGLLVGIVLLVLVLVVKPALVSQPIQSENLEVMDIAFTDSSAYFQLKRELGDWCKILLPIIGFALGRINGRKK